MTEPTSFGPSLSIVVPCFNEESRIVASLSELVSWFDERAEILAVDDGSGDRTFELVQRLGEAHPNVRAYRLPHNHGKGGAARAGLAMARGARVVLLDADLAFDRASVRAVVDALDGSEMAIGNRRHDASRYTVPVRLFGFLYRRHLVGLAFNAFVRGMLQIGFRDTQCGLKGFRREALRQILPSLTTNGFALDVEILLVARALPLHIVEVPVMVTYESARSSVALARSAVAMSADLIRIAGRRAVGCYSPARIRAAATAASPPPFPQSTEPTQ